MGYQKTIESALNNLEYEKHVTKQFYQELQKKYGSNFFDLIEETPWERDNSTVYEYNGTELYKYTCNDCELYAPKDIQLPPYPKLKANNSIILNSNLIIKGEYNELYNTIIDTKGKSDYLCCCRLIDTLITNSCQMLRVDANLNVPWREENQIDNKYHISVFLNSPHMSTVALETQINNKLFEKANIEVSNSYLANSKIINKTTINDAILYHSNIGSAYTMNDELTLESKSQNNIIEEGSQIINCEITDCVVEQNVVLNNINAFSHGSRLHFHQSLLEPNKRVIESDMELQNLYDHIEIVLNEGEQETKENDYQQYNDFETDNW